MILSFAARLLASVGASGILITACTIPTGQSQVQAIAAEPATGLQKPWPMIVVPPDNPTTAAKVELGRLLFYDPILSNNNTFSCAHCHHPDLGFSDGLPRALGYGGEGAGRQRTGGTVLPRRTPTLWNTAYSHRQYWDGRAKDLEDQCRFPITMLDEMKQNPDTLIVELHHVPEYEAMFDRAFGGNKGSAISLQNVTRAIACFERTIVSRNSRFDRYASGNDAALTEPEKRGLKLFLSTKTRCTECHGLPNFANADFKVVGVPDVPGMTPDPHKKEAEPGRGGGPAGAFKIPTLRNVALKAPYMHNGSLKSLDQVLDFYSNGGGRGKGLEVPLQDDKIRKYKLSLQEKTDLISFLGSLTDVSGMPPVPKEVPSGLPVAERFVARRQTTDDRRRNTRTVSTLNTQLSTLNNQRPKTIEVHAEGSIQAAIDAVGRGGTVRVYPGTYHESLLVIHHDVKLEGIVERGVAAAGSWPILDGRNEMSDAVIAMGNRFTISGFDVRNYQGNGVVVRGAKDVVMRKLVVSNPGDYGLYPVECDGVTVEKCVVSGAKDAGIYVGQSRRIVVSKNVVSENVAGIEIENSVGAVVEDNYAHDNTGGILVFVLPFNISKEARDCRVVHNRIQNNNTRNFAAQGAIVSNVLQGTGVMVLAADNTEVTENDISGNGTFGVAVVGLGMVYPNGTKYDVDPFADGTWVHGNTMQGNGQAPDPRLKPYGVPPRDLLWDLTGKRNRWDQPGATSFPAKLPAGTGN